MTSSAHPWGRLCPAKPSDVTRVNQLATQAGLTLDASAERRRASAELLVLRDTQVVIALAAVQRLGDDWELQELAVDALWRRRGVGRDVLLQLLARARAAGVARVLLEVAAGNLAARGLYRSCGFLEVGRRARYYASGEDAILMDCCLFEPK